MDIKAALARTLGAILTVLLLCCGVAVAADDASDADLYQSQAVVTGRGDTNRALGLAQCLQDVLVKVSGDPRLIGDPAAIALGANVAGLVTRFEYHDRLSGQPIHDEQGSYDRPQDLTVYFNKTALDSSLNLLGRQPWRAARPRVAVFLDIRPPKRVFVMTGDDDEDADMRSALQAAATKVGLPIALPTKAQLAQKGWTVQTLPTADLTKLNAVAKAGIGDTAFSGELVWSNEAMGWVADWRINGQHKTFHWQIRGVGFDDAFRNGMRGALQVLSGHGQPQ